jgi:hypothetical protein
LISKTKELAIRKTTKYGSSLATDTFDESKVELKLKDKPNIRKVKEKLK